MVNSENFSYWEQNTFFKEIDYLIIGAGIVGYSTALSIREKDEHAHIVILERGKLPFGASSKNAGFACFGSATELYSDIKTMPESEVWKTVKMRWNGLNHLRELIGDKNLDYQQNGSWDLISTEQKEIFKKTKDHLPYFNKKLKEITGVDNVFSIDQHTSSKFGFKQIETSIYNSLEGQVDTGKMNEQFFKKVVSKNINVLFSTEVHTISANKNEVIASTCMGEFAAKKVAICTNGFASRFIANEEIKPARAQVLITKPIKDLKIKGTFHYDSGYYYFRNIHNRILFGGGRNLDVYGETTTEINTTDKIIKSLKKILNEVILPNTDYEIDHKWAGIMGVGASKKPIIKQYNEHVYCGVRLGGMGVAIGTLVGKELASLILADKALF